MSSIIILGGGISGLSAAHYLLKYGKSRIKQITITEASGYLGGCIKSTRFDDGAIYECGPRSIRLVGAAGRASLALVEDLKLEADIVSVSRTNSSFKNRMLLVNDKLNVLPAGLSPIFRTTPPFSKPLLFCGLRDIFKKKETLVDDSMYSFAERRFGKEIADLLVDPLCRGVFAGNAKQLSVKTLMGNFFEAEQKHGSVIRGIFKLQRNKKIKNSDPDDHTEIAKMAVEKKWAMWNFRTGLQTLPEALVHRLSADGVNIRKNNPCRSVKFTGDGVEVVTDEGTLLADHVMSAIPAFNLSEILSKNYPELSKELATIPSVSVAVVTLEYPQPVTELLKQQGFGFLVPSNQPYPILGVVYDSCSFPEHDAPSSSRFTVMLGGSWFEELFGSSESVKESDLLATAENAIRQHLDISILPTRHQVSIYKNAIPQHMVGHYEKVESLRNAIDGLSLPCSLIGASFDGIGINNCILSSKQVVQKVLDKLI